MSADGNAHAKRVVIRMEGSRRSYPLRRTRRNPTAREVKKLLQAYTVEQVAEMLHVGRDKVLLPA